MYYMKTKPKIEFTPVDQASWIDWLVDWTFFGIQSDRKQSVNRKVLFYLQKRERAATYHLLRSSIYLFQSLRTRQLSKECKRSIPH